MFRTSFLRLSFLSLASLPMVILVFLGLVFTPADAQAAKAKAKAAGGASVRAWDHGDYGRIVFDWPGNVGYATALSGSTLTVSFAEPVSASLSSVTKNLSQYVKAVRVADDKRSVEFALTREFRLKDFAYEKRVVLDLYKNGGAPTQATMAQAEPSSNAPASMPAAPTPTSAAAGTEASATQTEEKKEEESWLPGDFYLAASAGMGLPGQSKNTGTNLNIDSSLDTGFVGTLAGGLDWRNGLRTEGEIGYRGFDADSLTVYQRGNNATLASGTGNGDVSALSMMVNVAYDFHDLPGLSKWVPAMAPFVMGGLGMAQVEANGLGASGVAFADDSDWVFAWQGGAGLGFALSERASIDLAYRYFSVADPSFVDASGTAFDSELSAHEFSLGLRGRF